VRKRDAAKVRFELGDATKMRFPSRSFDVVTVSFALHDMLPSIRERVLREMRRVVKPGGTILIVDYGLPRNGVGQALVYGLVNLYEGGTYREFIRSDLKSLLSRVGISVAEERAGVLGAARMWKAAAGGGRSDSRHRP
jgi:ubiquinone/menaquinone biosynthesis C-methylase UbiE